MRRHDWIPRDIYIYLEPIYIYSILSKQKRVLKKLFLLLLLSEICNCQSPAREILILT